MDFPRRSGVEGVPERILRHGVLSPALERQADVDRRR